MVDLLSNIAFAGFLLITGGAALALQAGIYIYKYIHSYQKLVTVFPIF